MIGHIAVKSLQRTVAIKLAFEDTVRFYFILMNTMIKRVGAGNHNGCNL